MAEQLIFDLPVKQALGRADFFISPSNQHAVAMLEGWRDWPERKVILTGAAGSGKSHLAQIWADEVGARIVPATEVPLLMMEELDGASIIVEDADQPLELAAETGLFHLHNLVLASGGYLMVTAKSPPSQWGLKLADLNSRMLATPQAALLAPDEGLLQAVLMKHFDDHQLSATPKLLTYMLKRMTRSLSAAREIVDEMDRLALSQKRKLSIDLASEVLDKLAPEAQ
ncbi:MAG: chromosomal replication initiator DnaA [Paracoccaceae bacterium]|nr:chromosomal replication initiator DnaA [Paracoccaceae bacterium]